MPNEEKKQSIPKNILAYWNEQAARFRTACSTAGILYILAAILILSCAGLEQPAVKIAAGVLLTAAGVGEILLYIWTPPYFHLQGEIVSSFLKFFSGLMLLVMTAEDAYLVLSIFLAVDRLFAGAIETALYRRIRSFAIEGTVGAAISGILNFLLSIAIVMALHRSATLEYILTLSLFGCGITLLIVQIGIKKLPEQ